MCCTAVAAELRGRLERQGHASNRSSDLPCYYRSGWGQQGEKELEPHTRPHRQVCPSLVKPGNDKPALHARWLHRTVLGNPAADSDHATVGEVCGERKKKKKDPKIEPYLLKRDTKAQASGRTSHPEAVTKSHARNVEN